MELNKGRFEMFKENDRVKIIDENSVFFNRIGTVFKKGNGNMLSIYFDAGYDIYFNEKDLIKIEEV
jgi:hypothetical protein